MSSYLPILWGMDVFHSKYISRFSDVESNNLPKLSTNDLPWSILRKDSHLDLFYAEEIIVYIVIQTKFRVLDCGACRCMTI